MQTTLHIFCRLNHALSTTTLTTITTMDVPGLSLRPSIRLELYGGGDEIHIGRTSAGRNFSCSGAEEEGTGRRAVA